MRKIFTFSLLNSEHKNYRRVQTASSTQQLPSRSNPAHCGLNTSLGILFSTVVPTLRAHTQAFLNVQDSHKCRMEECSRRGSPDSADCTTAVSDLCVDDNTGLPAHPTSGYEEGRGARASAVSKPVSVPSIRIALRTPEAPPFRLRPLVQSAAGASIRVAVPTRTLPRLRHSGSQQLCDEQDGAHALANLELPNKTCCCGTKDEPRPLREQSAASSIPWDTTRLPMLEYCPIYPVSVSCIAGKVAMV